MRADDEEWSRVIDVFVGLMGARARMTVTVQGRAVSHAEGVVTGARSLSPSEPDEAIIIDMRHSDDAISSVVVSRDAYLALDEMKDGWRVEITYASVWIAVI